MLAPWGSRGGFGATKCREKKKAKKDLLTAAGAAAAGCTVLRRPLSGPPASLFGTRRPNAADKPFRFSSPSNLSQRHAPVAAATQRAAPLTTWPDRASTPNAACRCTWSGSPQAPARLRRRSTATTTPARNWVARCSIVPSDSGAQGAANATCRGRGDSRTRP